MELQRVFIADFETDAIAPRPAYPPKPVGLALLVPGQRPHYHAWGHPTKNNSSMADAKRHYKTLLREGRVPVFHHAGFDLDVMDEHVGVAPPAEHHDTLILAFQSDPRAKTFSLKPTSERLLNIPPTERDELKEWIIANVPEAKRAKAKWGAYISRAPGDLVGRYACSDVKMTGGLFRHFCKSVLSDPLQRGAYERERRLTWLLVKMERRGIPVATLRLARDVPKFERALLKLEDQLMGRLKVPKSKREEFQWSGDTLADQLERVGAVTEWIMTDPSDAHPDGQRSTSIDSLKEVGVEKTLLHELETRSLMQTCLSTFMRPWLESGRANEDRMYARFNQVRQDYHGGGGRLIGTETGRLSMTPNLQNATRSDKDDRVPLVRDYLTPGVILNGKRYPVGRIGWGKRDYSQQEFRILAHYEDGPLLRKYLDDPTIDSHNAVKALIYELAHVMLDRRDTKDLNFGLVYGMGVAKTAIKIGKTVAETRALVRAHIKALPGVDKLKKELKLLEDNGQPLYTWGGRKYYCEPGAFVKKFGRYMTFGYKLLNLKIQGSAADCTKQAMVNYDEAGHDDEFPLILQVHDELNALALASRAKAMHLAMGAAMLDVDFKVPMLSDGAFGTETWHRIKKVAW